MQHHVSFSTTVVTRLTFTNKLIHIRMHMHQQQLATLETSTGTD